MNKSLLEIAGLFFRLGCIAFGGPAAHIAMMEKEVVEKKKWMSREHFLDLVGATNLIPGPNSTEMTMHCGHERAGWKGLFIAGISFIFPAVLMTGVLAWLYQKYGQLPDVGPFIYGIKPAVLAIILGAVYKLGQKAVKNYELAILGAMTLLASVLGVNEIVALLCAGVLGAIYFWSKNKRKSSIPVLAPLVLLQTSSLLSISGGSLKIFFTFLKVGAVLYGSGYVLFAYLDAELVVKGLLSRQELIDAIAIGQFTPGPVLSTATFIGYQMNGVEGAIAATAGIFLPSFLFVWMLNPMVPKMRKSLILSHFLNCVNVAAVAVMASVLISMGIDVLQGWQPVLIGLLSVGVTFIFPKINSMWIILGGALSGYGLHYF